jgi:hypothetical protein
MIPELVRLVTAQGDNGLIGTNEVAHGASHASISRVGLLANAVVDLKDVGWLGVKAHGCFDHPLSMDTEFNGVHRANGRAATAKRAPVFVPTNLPWQVFNTQCGRGNFSV